jgi:hypothetical protein
VRRAPSLTLPRVVMLDADLGILGRDDSLPQTRA